MQLDTFDIVTLSAMTMLLIKISFFYHCSLKDQNDLLWIILVKVHVGCPKPA